MNRDFRLFWTGETASRFGSRISSVALPLLAIGLNATTFQIGLLAAASWLPWLLIGLPAGAWVDRLPRRPVMLTSNIASMLLMASVPVAAVVGRPSYTHLLVVALLTGVASVFFQTADQVYLTSLLGKQELVRANARIQGSSAVADVTGPAAAGALAQTFGVVTGLLADAVTFLISTICLLRIKSSEPASTARPSRRLGREIVEGLRFVSFDGYLRSLTLSGAAANLALTGYQSILIVFLVREIGLSNGAVGALLTAMSLGGLLGAAMATRLARRFGNARAILLSNGIAAPFGLLVPMSGPGPRLALVAIAGIVIGIGVVAGNVLRGTFRQTYTPSHLLGRVTVSMQFLNYGTIPLGAILGGALGDGLGLRPALWVMTAAGALAPLILLLGPIRGRREMPTSPVSSEAMTMSVGGTLAR